jgi:hypothetical protein
VQSTQFDYTRVDLTPRNRYINYVTHAKGAGMVTTTYRSDVELLYLLQKSNAPIRMYDQIQKWARKSYAINPKVFLRSNLTRKKALQSIEKSLMQKIANPFPLFVNFHCRTIKSPFKHTTSSVQCIHYLLIQF